MNEEDKFIDKVQLVLSALLFGGLLFGYIVLLGSFGIPKEWQRFWGGGLITYLICLFVLRKDMFFKRKKSLFSNKIMHYLFVLLGLMVPVVFLALFFKFKEKLMPLDLKAYSFGGAGLAVIVSIFIGEIINKKNPT
jgi:membrane protease YdiL (CAAX protease family)